MIDKGSVIQKVLDNYKTQNDNLKKQVAEAYLLLKENKEI